MPLPKKKIKIIILVILSSRLSDWWANQVNAVALPDSGTTEPEVVEIDEGELSEKQIDAINAFAVKMSNSTGIGTLTITPDDPTELTDILGTDVVAFEFVAPTQQDLPDSEWCESECTDPDQIAVVNNLSLLAA